MKNFKRRTRFNNGILIDETFRGELQPTSSALVMDNTISRNSKMEPRLKVTTFITDNEEILAGNNTVAIFRLLPLCKHDGKIISGHHPDQPCRCDICGEEL